MVYLVNYRINTKNTLEVANEIYESGLVSASYPDFNGNVEINTNDPLFSRQWGLNNSSYEDVDISIEGAWNYSLGTNIKIAVIDTGVDYNHPDLADKIYEMFDTETKASVNGLYKGRDTDSIPGSHGTHCAGIIAAICNNNKFIAGVAPNVKIMPTSTNFAYGTNSGSKLSDAINWAYQRGADILSCSWSLLLPSEIVEEAIDNALRYGRDKKGCIVVFAAGNDNMNDLSYPAIYSQDILTVGSISNMGNKSYFSNYGTKLDLVAPGENVCSLLPNNYFGYMSGTSMAAPHVAAVAALVLQINTNFKQEIVCDILQRTCKKISNYSFNSYDSFPNGTWNEYVGYGLINAEEAVQTAILLTQDYEIQGPSFLEKGKSYSFYLSDSLGVNSVEWYLEGASQKAVITSNSTNPNDSIIIKTQGGQPIIMTLNAKLNTFGNINKTITKTIYPNTDNTTTFTGGITQHLCSYNNVTYPEYIHPFTNEITQYVYPGCQADIHFLEDTVLGWTIESFNAVPSWWTYDAEDCLLSVSLPKLGAPYSFRFTSEYGTKAFNLFTWSDNSVHSMALSTDQNNLYIEITKNSENNSVYSINSSTEVEKIIEIINISTAERVAYLETTNNNISLSTTNWIKGYYVVNVYIGNEVLTNKFANY